MNLSLLCAFFSLGTERLWDERSHKAQYKFLLLLDGAVAATALFCMEVFRHIIITFCRFANNDITQSPYCGYDLLQITKCYYMEISFHTRADWRGALWSRLNHQAENPWHFRTWDSARRAMVTSLARRTSARRELKGGACQQCPEQLRPKRSSRPGFVSAWETEQPRITSDFSLGCCLLLTFSFSSLNVPSLIWKENCQFQNHHP